MEHEQLALISPALLDKILNHLEGGQKNAKSESTHVPDTNIHQTLLQQDDANMNDALFLFCHISLKVFLHPVQRIYM